VTAALCFQTLKSVPQMLTGYRLLAHHLRELHHYQERPAAHRHPLPGERLREGARKLWEKLFEAPLPAITVIGG